MLRTSLRSVRAVGSRPVAAAAGRQWQPAIARIASANTIRSFADEKKPSINDPKQPVLPASETTTSAASTPPPAPETAAPTEALNVPLTPPAPDAVASSTSPNPNPAVERPIVKKKGFFRRLRSFVFTVTLLGALAFGGGVWYSRINDNFHDFFTEYVPFGEQAVLYLEELDLKKRLPSRSGLAKPRETGSQVKVPAQSGASWRVADAGEPAGRQSSAVRDIAATEPKESKPALVKEPSKPVVEAKEPPKAAAVSKAESPKSEPAAFRAPEVNEPSRFPPAAPIDPLKVNDATEPVVQDLTKMLNDIITVVNADNADDRFGATISKAKNELNQVGSKIRDLKAAVEKQAAAEVKAKVVEFEKAASDLVSRVEAGMLAQESRWRDEFEEEMTRVREAFEKRNKAEVERQHLVNEERLNNKLLQQAIDLKREFTKEIKSRVEAERGERLGKLDKLSSSVKELENLTTGWNDVVDLNLKTQQLHVAVEAVRASLEDAAHPRPFVRELVALKEIANDDPVVGAAIASINPSAYQRGIAAPSQLIDRFRRVATEVRKASLLPEDAGVASHASSWLLSKVLFKKQGLAAGDDVESILTRAQTYLEEGDLDNAAREVNGLQGWAKTLSKDWLGEVRKILEVQQALDVISTEARLQSLKVEA